MFLLGNDFWDWREKQSCGLRAVLGTNEGKILASGGCRRLFYVFFLIHWSAAGKDLSMRFFLCVVLVMFLDIVECRWRERESPVLPALGMDLTVVPPGLLVFF